MVGEKRKPTKNKNDNDAAKNTDTQLVGRRSALKALGAATVAASLPSSVGSAAAAGSDYDVITVSSGNTKKLTATPSDPLENLLIDITASGADIRIRTSGDGWVIRNVGVRGKFHGGFSTIVRGSGRFENVYFGDGVTEGETGGGVWHDQANITGEVVYDRFHVAQVTNNGVYGAPTHEPLTSKPVHYTNCYFANNHGSQLKIGSPLGTSSMTNCVIRTDGYIPTNGDGYSNTRGVWALHDKETDGSVNTTTILLKDCDIKASLNHTGKGFVTLENTRWEGESTNPDRITGQSVGQPDLRPPEGCPMTPEQAASGEGAPPKSKFDHSIVVRSEPSVQAAEFTLTVTGDAAKTTIDGVSSEPADTIETTADGLTAITGRVGNGYGDAFAYNGDVEGFELTSIEAGSLDGLSFEIDGKPVDTGTIIDGTGYDHDLVIMSDSTVEEAWVRLVVTGAAAKTTIDGTGSEDHDTIESLSDGRTEITSKVGNGYGDAFAYDGEIEVLELTSIAAGELGDLSAEIDGESVDIEMLGADPSAPKLLVIDGTKSPEQTARYEVTVSDTIERDADNSTVADGGLPWDSMEDYVGDGTAAGLVGNGVDAYRFTGTLDSISIDGDADYEVRPL